MRDFDQYSDVIDSRDVIARLDELEEHLVAVHEEETGQGGNSRDFEGWLQEAKWRPDVEEYLELRSLEAEASSSPDWQYGEQLINEEYFTRYIKELIEDCYQMPEELHSGGWPWSHMTLDYEAAAEEAKHDYTEVAYFGQAFLIRA